MSDRGEEDEGTGDGEDQPGDTRVDAASSWFQDHRTLTFLARSPEPTLKRMVGAPERLYDWWFRRFDERTDEKRNRIVEAHPDGTAIVAHLRAEGGLTWEDWDVYNEIADPVLPTTGWPFKLHYWFEKRGPLRRSEEIEAFVQRARRGRADRDTYDLDHYLAGVIAGSLRHLARTTHGWPGEGSGWASHQAWTEAVETLADDFDRLRRPEKYPEGERVSSTEVLARLATLWPTLWD